MLVIFEVTKKAAHKRPENMNKNISGYALVLLMVKFMAFITLFYRFYTDLLTKCGKSASNRVVEDIFIFET